MAENFNENLNQKLHQMQKKSIACDLKLKTSDNKTILVHRNILLASPSYLCSKLESNPTTDKIHIDICKAQLQIIVDYLYTGVVDDRYITLEEMKNLYKTANIMLLPNLQKYSTDKLMEFLNVPLSLDIWRHAIHFSIEELIEESNNFIISNSESFLTTHLKSLQPNEIEILVRILSSNKVFSDLQLFDTIKKWIAQDLPRRKQYIDEILLRNVALNEIPENDFETKICTDEILLENKNFQRRIIAIQRSRENRTRTSQETKTLSVITAGGNKYQIFSFSGLNIDSIDFEGRDIVPFYTAFKKRIRFSINNFQFNSKEYILISGGTCVDSVTTNRNSNSFMRCLFSSIKPSRRGLSSCYIWRPNSLEPNGQFRGFTPLPRRRFDHRTMFLDEKIYICGGSTTISQAPSKTMDFYDCGTEKWYTGRDMNHGKKHFGLTSFENCLYAFGSRNIEFYDPRVGIWKTINKAPTKELFYSKAVSFSSTSILCFTSDANGYFFDCKMNRWLSEQTQSERNSGGGLSLLPNDRIDGVVSEYNLEKWNCFDVIKVDETIYGCFMSPNSTKHFRKFNNETLEWLDLDIKEYNCNPNFPVHLTTLTN